MEPNECPVLKTISIVDNPDLNIEGFEQSKFPKATEMKLNNLDLIMMNFVSPLENLKNLDLASNRINKMKWIFDGRFPKLENLHLERNMIDRLELYEH